VRFSPSLLKLFTDVVVLQEPVGVNRYNEPDYTGSTPTSYRARVDYKPREIRTLAGDERVASVTIRLAPVKIRTDGSLEVLDEPPAVTPSVRLVLPDGNEPLVLSVAMNRDNRGKRQVEIFA
jgi:hypothetical protein